MSVAARTMLRAEKKSLRGEMRKRLSELSESYIASESSQLASRVVALPCFTEAKSTSM
jgi:5-formyltetrahydrofolate cyclo-ligase